MEAINETEVFYNHSLFRGERLPRTATLDEIASKEWLNWHPLVKTLFVEQPAAGGLVEYRPVEEVAMLVRSTDSSFVAVVPRKTLDKQTRRRLKSLDGNLTVPCRQMIEPVYDEARAAGTFIEWLGLMYGGLALVPFIPLRTYELAGSRWKTFLALVLRRQGSPFRYIVHNELGSGVFFNSRLTKSGTTFLEIERTRERDFLMENQMRELASVEATLDDVAAYWPEKTTPVKMRAEREAFIRDLAVVKPTLFNLWFQVLRSYNTAFSARNNEAALYTGLMGRPYFLKNSLLTRLLSRAKKHNTFT